MAWTKHDRVMAVLSGEKPDRVPIFECVAHDGVLEHFGSAPIAVGDLRGVLRACAEFLDLCHPALVPNEPAVIEHEDGGRETVERWTRWHQSPPLSPDDVTVALQAQIAEAQAWRPGATAAAEFARKASETRACCGDLVYIHLGAACPILPFDLEQGFYACADHPELVRRWNRAVNDRQLRELDCLATPRALPVCILWNDLAAKGGLIYPPALLEELFWPHLRRQIDLLHSRGIKVLFHSDGDATSVLPKLVECGIDAFNPLEITAGMRVEDFQEICGKRVALVGGIDAVDVLALGTPAEVAAATRKLIDRFRATGNLMVASASGEIDESMPTANVLAMYETTWDYGDFAQTP